MLERMNVFAPRKTSVKSYIGTLEHELILRERAEKLLTLQTQILESIANGQTLQLVMDSVVRSIESVSVHMRASILLFDKVSNSLLNGSAVSLPESYVQAINGVKIGDNIGSCGTAAFLNQTSSVLRCVPNSPESLLNP